jgi:hypothetical protein
MGIKIITELKTKAGRSEYLIALLRELLPSSLQHGGAEEISIRQNQDDPNYIISVQLKLPRFRGVLASLVDHASVGWTSIACS